VLRSRRAAHAQGGVLHVDTAQAADKTGINVTVLGQAR
jgi:hypothetical protein